RAACCARASYVVRPQAFEQEGTVNGRGVRTGLARAWRNFRRWRRARPFWGGLLLILSGAEIFLSGNLSLGSLTLKVGQQGFLPYVIPAVLILCGLLTWFTPQQRLFYGIVGAIVAVYSLIGVNLGGFLLGLILGVLGAGFAVAWTPVAPVVPWTPAPEPAPAP